MIYFDTNPFCTARVRPGQLPYRFSPTEQHSDPQQLAQLVVRWREANRIAQIVGPHGCGKSTLACSLASSIVADPSEAATAIRTIVFRRGQANDGGAQADRAGWWQPYRIARGEFSTADGSSAPPTSPRKPRDWITVVDGLEVVPRWLRGIALRYVCGRSRDCLVTAHRPLQGIAVLHSVQPDIQTFAELARGLAGDRFVISDAQIQAAFLKANGSCREGLMNLYDVVEQQQE